MSSLLPESAIRRLQDASVQRVVVAVSSGVDSMSLLHAVYQLALPVPLLALHIDHGMQPASSSFAELCRRTCESLAIPLEVIKVKVSTVGSLEANARQARYAAFESRLEAGDLLLLAHHVDDQVETALFRLFRGSGVPGLEGMPAERDIAAATLYRPLLTVSREVIEDYARVHTIVWLEDPTNAEVTPDRNFIRHEVLPLIEQRWPHVRQVLRKGLERDRKMRERIHTADDGLLAGCLKSSDALYLDALVVFAQDQCESILKAWFRREGRPLPSVGQIEEIARSILAHQSVNVIEAEFELRQHGDALYLLNPVSAVLTDGFNLAQGTRDIGVGNLTCTETLDSGLLPGDYAVRFRRGGEKLKIGRHRTLKNICQENGIPAWLRDRVPLIFKEDELVAVAGLPAWDVPMLVADLWRASSGSSGLSIRLETLDRRGHSAAGAE